MKTLLRMYRSCLCYMYTDRAKHQNSGILEEGHVSNKTTLTEMQEKLSKRYSKLVSTSTISGHFHEYGYKNVLPQSTHMLTSDGKHQRIQRVKRYKSDDYTSTIFTDETSFQLFPNTIQQWSKTPHNKSKCSPKNVKKFILGVK